jgi:hypothetical protein
MNGKWPSYEERNREATKHHFVQTLGVRNVGFLLSRTCILVSWSVACLRLVLVAAMVFLGLPST